MWTEGSIKVKESIIHYWIKRFDEGSEFGIDGGRISKLMLKKNGRIVANYDRGWDTLPDGDDAKIAYAILIKEYNYRSMAGAV